MVLYIDPFLTVFLHIVSVYTV